jgi:hypothetical protein
MAVLHLTAEPRFPTIPAMVPDMRKKSSWILQTCSPSSRIPGVTANKSLALQDVIEVPRQALHKYLNHTIRKHEA